MKQWYFKFRVLHVLLTVLHLRLGWVGFSCYKDLRHVNNIKVISRLESRIYTLSHSQVARLRIEPRIPCSARPTVNDSKVAAP